MRKYRSSDIDTFGLCSVKDRHKNLVSRRGKKRSFLYDRAVSVKEILLSSLESKTIPDLSKLVEKLDEKFAEIGYETNATAHAQAVDYAHLIKRYLKDEKKELIGINLPAIEYTLNNGDVISVKPDVIFKEVRFGRTTYYCIKYSCSSKHINKTSYEPTLFAWYCKKFLADMGQPIEENDIIEAGYYYLRKGGDSSGEYSSGFFNSATTQNLYAYK